MSGGFRVGNHVWWTDPDQDRCSGSGTVIEIRWDAESEGTDDPTIIVLMDDGGELECLGHELTRLPQNANKLKRKNQRAK